LKICVQNLHDKILTLRQGQFIARIEIKKTVFANSKFEWNELNSNEESMDTTNANNNELLDIAYYHMESDPELVDIREGLEKVNPNRIIMGSLKINLCQNEMENGTELDFLSLVDKISLHKSSCVQASNLPSIYSKDKSELENLFSVDISEFKQLKKSEFIDLQNADSKIKMIKDIICDKGFKNGLNKFLIKKDVLCRKVYNKKKGRVFLTVYMPSQILRML